MPKVSTIGLVNKVRQVNVSTHYAPDDTFLTIGPTAAGALVFTLPGPTSSPGDLPSNGDFYQFGDPLGRLGGGRTITINGGGYNIQGAATLGPFGQFFEGTFTFDDAAQCWIACVCAPQES